MLIEKFYGRLEIHREEKIIYARFLSPHRVISTSRAAGGLTSDLDFVINHQSCEPQNHYLPLIVKTWSDQDRYRHLVCDRHNLPADRSAILGTAANMNNAAVIQEDFRDLIVAAVVTGGVETNAGRIGDPAPVYEIDGRFESIDGSRPVEHGTINIMLFINRELTDGALVRSVMTATEAKTAALAELAVNSRYSDGLATGTGTDQIAVACLLGTGLPLTGAGKHTKLGEMIGRVTARAVKQTLVRQNGLTPDRQCSVRKHLERFGLEIGEAGKRRMKEKIMSLLPEDRAGVLAENFDVIDRDPLTAAAVAALVHVRDKIVWGIFPENCLAEIMTTQGALAAAAASGKYERLNFYREKLAEKSPPIKAGPFLDYVLEALAMGFNEKWEQYEDVGGLGD